MLYPLRSGGVGAGYARSHSGTGSVASQSAPRHSLSTGRSIDAQAVLGAAVVERMEAAVDGTAVGQPHGDGDGDGQRQAAAAQRGGGTELADVAGAGPEPADLRWETPGPGASMESGALLSSAESQLVGICSLRVGSLETAAGRA